MPRAGLGTYPRVKMLWQERTPSSALFQRGLCCDIGLTFPKLDRFLRDWFLKGLFSY